MSEIHSIAHISKDVTTITEELVRAGNIQAGQIIVFGVSTSEVLGKHIGTSGTEEVAQQIFDGIEIVRSKIGFYTAFQCCEHLNRALVIEKQLLLLFQQPLEEVSAIPVAKAGGSMATYAYRHMKEPCMVETIQAHGGIDIGDTFIGMHLRRVAVPVRPTIRTIGQGHVTMAYTRPKLIGGERAVYSIKLSNSSESCL